MGDLSYEINYRKLTLYLDMEKMSLERRVRCYFSCSDELGD